MVNRRFVKYNSSDEVEQEDKLSAHTLQNKKTEYITEEFSNLRILTDSFREKIRPKENYKFNDQATVYFRERSLHLGEIRTLACNELIEFKEFKYKKIVLIYAGSAPSKQLNQLHDMFP